MPRLLATLSPPPGAVAPVQVERILIAPIRALREVVLAGAGTATQAAAVRAEFPQGLPRAHVPAAVSGLAAVAKIAATDAKGAVLNSLPHAVATVAARVLVEATPTTFSRQSLR